jgi:hypothetical protein
MNTQERQVIDGLFDKLREAERQAGPREPIAEAHIRTRIEGQPGAPYYMAQTIVMQEQALQAAQEQIAHLEDELARRPAGGGGFLSSLFGSSGQTQPQYPQQGEPDNMQGMAARPGRLGTTNPAAAGMAPGQGGGFLAGAAQTAMGVAGGMFLGSMIGHAFRSGEARAAEPAQPQAEPASTDNGASGGDFGDEI